MQQHLLVVDDNEDVRNQMKWGLSQDPFVLHLAKDADEALALFRRIHPGVVTLDLGLPPHENSSVEGFRCLTEMLRQRTSAKIVVITGNDERENARKAIEMGAYDFYKKPIDLGELRVIIRRAFNVHSIEDESIRLRREEPEGAGDHWGIVGACPAMREIFQTIEKVANSDVPILVSGESGTGKELVARAVHARSHRRSGPMVSINCGAIPENLLESEFFGHEKGAFTGAVSTVHGKVEYASGGTLFLDEIGELPGNLQVKILRFLQEMVIQRVGGRKDIEVDVRIVAATNVNIHEAMRRGQFREDLYYRIGVVHINLPPLRERGDDIFLLAEHFLRTVGQGLGKEVQGFTPESLALMGSYPWPGNIRELENKVRRAVIMAGGARITPQDLALDGSRQSRPRGDFSMEHTTLKEARSMVERQMVLAALEKFNGNIVKASEALGISRPTMYDLLKKHEIES